MMFVNESLGRVARSGLGLLALSACLAGLAAEEPKPAQPARSQRLGLLEAVRLTLAQDPNIQLQERQIDIAKGALQSARGQFDLTLDTALSRGLTGTPRTELERINSVGRAHLTETVRDVTDYRLGLSKQFRSGLTVSPGIEITRSADNLDEQPALNRANISFVVNVPLLKGLGREATGAAERAARVGHEAAALDLQHVIATRVLNVASAYWNCLGAEKQAAILKASENRAAELVDRVRELVKAGEFPAAELKQVQADQAEKTAARIAGEQRFWQAQQNLALALGLPADKLMTPPVPEETFPRPPAEALPWRFQGQPVLERSLNRRADYQSALKAQQAAEILLAAARNNVKPQLDLNLEVGYAGLDEGSQFRRFFSSLETRNYAGPNALATLRLNFPLANNAARGLLLQRDAAHQQSLIRSQDLARNISSGILVALNELEQTIEELKKAHEAAGYYREAVENEREKLRIGTSTVIDVITTADRLSNALVNEISAQSRYATSLARVRFETGLLVPPATDRSFSLSLEDFITIPQVDLIESPRARP
ncbi:MAG: TolC family protein [Verrucomicrobiota bacterium]